MTLAVEVGGKPRQLEWTVAALVPTSTCLSDVAGRVSSAGWRLAAGDAGHAGLNEIRRLLDEGDGSPGQAWQSGHYHRQPGNRRTAGGRGFASRSDGSNRAGRAETTGKDCTGGQAAAERNGRRPDCTCGNSKASRPRRRSRRRRRYRAPRPTPPPLDPLSEGAGPLPGNVEQQRRLITAQMRAEVENELREARADGHRPGSGRTRFEAVMDASVADAANSRPPTRARLRHSWKRPCAKRTPRSATKDIIDQQIKKPSAPRHWIGCGSPTAWSRSGEAQAVDGPLQFADGRRPLRGGRQIGSRGNARPSRPTLPITASAALVAHADRCSYMANLSLRNDRAEGGRRHAAPRWKLR